MNCIFAFQLLKGLKLSVGFVIIKVIAASAITKKGRNLKGRLKAEEEKLNKKINKIPKKQPKIIFWIQSSDANKSFLPLTVHIIRNKPYPAKQRRPMLISEKIKESTKVISVQSHHIANTIG